MRYLSNNEENITQNGHEWNDGLERQNLNYS